MTDSDPRIGAPSITRTGILLPSRQIARESAIPALRVTPLAARTGSSLQDEGTA